MLATKGCAQDFEQYGSLQNDLHNN